MRKGDGGFQSLYREACAEHAVLTPSPFLIQSCDNIVSLQKHSQMVRTSKVISLVIYLQLDKFMM
jgi:hypothetical protein